MAIEREMGHDPQGFTRTGTGTGRQESLAQRGNHRQPVGEDHAKRGQRGFDNGKKVKGRKQHIAVDTLGLLLVVAVHAAHISDTRGIRLLLIRLAAILPNLLKIFVDGGDKTGCLTWAKAMFGYCLEVVKRTDTGFKILPKRWIVERTFAWLSFHRRLNRDYEHNPKSSEANIKIAMIGLMLARLTHSH